jgi:glycosyltransferase involved in cell wall biosynthesis
LAFGLQSVPKNRYYPHDTLAWSDGVSPKVTVCIPAHRSEAFINNTLRSVLAQTYSDFVVEIAVEPPASETLTVCEPFLRDDRVR